MEATTRGRELSPGMRMEIIGMCEGGISFAAVGRKLNMSEDTVRKIWNRQKIVPSRESAPRSGRPSKFTDRDRRHIVRYVTKNRTTRREPLADISKDLNLNVHPDTIAKVLKDAGLNHRIERKRPFLTNEHRKKRLEFAHKYIHFTLDDWIRVIFTDEMVMQTGQDVGQHRVWRFPEEEYKEDCCAATHISGFKKIKVWGGMRYGKLSALVVLEENKENENFNAEEYCSQILDNELFNFWMISMEELGNVIVMEDGAPYHKGVASVRRKQYEEDGWISWGPGIWPPNSPDLNPMENLWRILRINVRRRNPRPMKKAELIAALKEEWEKLDISQVQNLIRSMPDRLRAVIAAKGGSIGY